MSAATGIVSKQTWPLCGCGTGLVTRLPDIAFTTADAWYSVWSAIGDADALQSSGGMLSIVEIVVVVMLAVPTTKPTTLSAVQCKGRVTSTERCQQWSIHRPFSHSMCRRFAWSSAKKESGKGQGGGEQARGRDNQAAELPTK